MSGLRLLGLVAVCVTALPMAAEAAAVSPEPAPVPHSENARLQYVARYPACGGVEHVGTGPVPVGLRGLSPAAMARMLAPATVEVGADGPVVVRDLPGCPTDTVTLTAQDGRIVVLAGPPGDNPAVLRRTAIAVRGLPPADAERAAAGWGVPAAELSVVLGRLAGEALNS